MIDLARTIRFCVNFDKGDAGPRHNTFAGWPSMHGVGAYYECDIVCRGEPDPLTGYMLNISWIDRAARQHVVPLIESAVRCSEQEHPGMVLRRAWEAIQPSLSHSMISMRWKLTPYYSVTMNSKAPDRVMISQQFEFSAAHRLNVPGFNAEQNREIFGKCNNVNGHGHNYKVEVAVSLQLGAAMHLSLPLLEQIVDQTVIQRFDHKHLNLDTAEFRNVNPSVENIAKVCFELLRAPIEPVGGKLERITVWETEKTRCSYPADNAFI